MPRGLIGVERPDLLLEWHPTLNGKHPDQVTCGSSYRAWWICSDLEKNVCGHHVYQSSVVSRASKNGKGNGCPFCSGSQVCPCKSLATLRPDILTEWDWVRNTIDPRKLSIKSSQTASWVCLNHKSCDQHRWTTTIYQRTTGAGSGCPYCDHHTGKVCLCDSMGTLFPSLIQEWDFERNIGINPYALAPRSHIKCWWKCDKSTCEHVHSYQATPKNRCGVNGTECPRCDHNIVCEHGCDSFGVLYPDLLREWDWELNTSIGLDPYKCFPGSSALRAHWICETHKTCNLHRWSTMIRDRVNNNLGCPYCGKRNLCPCKTFPALYPSIFEEWNYDRNIGIDPYLLHRCSEIRVWWRCRSCSNEWECRLPDRTYGDSGCPKCASSKGEAAINKHLESLGIEYSKKRVKIDDNRHEFDCVAKIPYMDNFVYLYIEFDGEQHFRMCSWYKVEGTFEMRHQRDLDKDRWCLANGVPLLRVPYTQIDNIPSILNEIISRIHHYTYTDLLTPNGSYYTINGNFI